MPERPRLLVRVVRKVKADSSFDIDPAIRTTSLVAYLWRRFVMLVRGCVLGLRSGRFALPVFVGRGVVVTNASTLRLSPGVTIGDYCRLDCLGRTGIDLGRGVTLRRGVHIEVTSVLREMGEGCVIGERAGISEGTFIGAKGPVQIGADTIVGPQCLLIAENHVFADPHAAIRGQGTTRAGIRVGADCWLGGGVKVLDGVALGDGCVIGAGAVVTKDVPPMSIAWGVPARVERSRV
jgi:acetyltransferase-like isoleucine patch superfamily enzyme